MKTYLAYGFALALGGLLLNVILFFLGFHSDVAKFGLGQKIGTIGGIAITFAAIVLGTKARRAEISPSQSFGYSQALGAGVMITLFGSLFGIAAQLVYFQLINPGLNEVIIQAQLQALEASGMSSEDIDKAESTFRRMLHPGLMAVFSFIGSFIFGAVISLVTAAFLRRPESSAPPQLP